MEAIWAQLGRIRFPELPLLGYRHLVSSPSMAAMAEDPELARAMARLDTLTDWERRPRGAMRVGLEPMLDLAERLGNPQRAFRVVHVAGTKGKGSVSALIEAALGRAGLAVGRYASPHVERVTERVSVQGRDIDEASLARALNQALDAYEAAREAKTPAADATWFDLLTAAAFLIFREAGVEWAVVEVGLGGRLELDQHRQRRTRRSSPTSGLSTPRFWARPERRSRARKSASSSPAPCSSRRSTPTTKPGASCRPGPTNSARL